MNTDTGASGSLADELAKAAELLKQKGLGHAAEALLSQSESEKSEKAEPAKAEVSKPKRQKRAVKAAQAEEKAEKKRKKKAAKKASPVKAKGKTERTKPTTGQSGPKIKHLSFDDLNRKEKLVVGCFELSGTREVRTIKDLAEEAFRSQTVKKANSWTRNSLRRLVRAGWLDKTEPGSYRLSADARTWLKKQ